MRVPPLLTIAAAGLTAAAGLATPVAAAPPDDGTIPGSWIVTVVDGASPNAVATDHRGRHGAEVAHVYEHVVRGYAARMSDAAIARVSRDSRVASVVADRTVSIAKPTAKPGGGGGGGGSTGQTLPTGVDRVDADVSTVLAGDGGGAEVDVDVAVIDTGIDRDHPDLNVVGGKNCSSGSSYDDGNGHGSHVAGTIAAKDDGTGVVGVAPGARLWAVRVLNNAGSGSWSSIICGVDWVTAMASTIEVANMSLGGAGSDTGCNDGGMHSAICTSVAAGVTYVVAAGNDAADAAGFVPAAYDEVITVSALADFDGVTGGQAASTCRSDVDDTFADFSNHGADVDLIAPGVCISSTWKGGGYNTISGTSMAAPHVAGAAALYELKQPGATPAQVKAALQGTGGTDWDNRDDRDGTKEPLLNVSAH